MEDIWGNTAVMNELLIATRECQFDFERVAERVSAIARRSVPASNCREQFARDFEASCGGGGQDALVDEAITELDSTKEIHENLTEAYNDADTFADVMLRIEEEENRNFRRKEEIFERVLSSLGGPDMLGTSADARIMVEEAISDVHKAFKDAQITREAAKKKREQRRLEALEQEALLKQRMQLQRRFDEGSIDAQGVSWEPSAQLEEEDNDETTIELSSTFRIEEVLESAEFDAMLAGIEEDLNATAGEKEEWNSELSEVLKFLDENASRRKTQVASKRTPESNASKVEDSNPPPLPTISLPSESLPITNRLSQTTSQSSTLPSAPKPAQRDPVKLTSRAPKHERIVTQEEEEEEEEDGDDDEEDESSSWRTKRAAIKGRSASVPSRVFQVEIPQEKIQMTQITIEESDESEENDSLDDSKEESMSSELHFQALPHPHVTTEPETKSRSPNEQPQIVNSSQAAVFMEQENDTGIAIPGKFSIATVGGSLAATRRDRERVKPGIMSAAKVISKREITSLTTEIVTPVTSGEGVQEEVKPELAASIKEELISAMSAFPRLPSAATNHLIIQGRVSTAKELISCMIGACSSKTRVVSINVLDQNACVVFAGGDKSDLNQKLSHFQVSSYPPEYPLDATVYHHGAKDSQVQTFCFLLRSYMLSPDHAHSLEQFLQLCESKGLLLVGVQTFYPSNNCIDPRYRRFIQPVFCNQNPKDDEGKMVVMLAFSGIKNDMLGVFATDIFRDSLGPEDPSLAQKTDPSSARARFGKSKDLNIGISIPFTAMNIKRDLQFWFGSTESNTTGANTRKTILKPLKRFHTAIFIFPVIENADSFRLQASQVAILTLCHRALCCGLASESEYELLSSDGQLAEMATPNEIPAMALKVFFGCFIEDDNARDLFIFLHSGVDNVKVEGKFWPVKFVFNSGQPKPVSIYPVESTSTPVDPSNFGSHLSSGIADTVIFVMKQEMRPDQKAICFQQREFCIHEIISSFSPGVATTIIAMGATAEGEFALCVRALGAYEAANEWAAAINQKLFKVCDQAKIQITLTVRALKGAPAFDYLQFHFLSRARCFYSLALTESSELCPSLARNGASAIFPPVEFHSCGVVFIPISSGSRLLSRVVRRLERTLDVLALEVSILDHDILKSMEIDALNVYGLSHAPCLTSHANSLFFCILVRGIAALGNLKNTIGPPDIDVAESSFSKSLVNTLSGVNSGTIELFATLTVSRTDVAIRHAFGRETSRALDDRALFTVNSSQVFPMASSSIVEGCPSRLSHDRVMQLNPVASSFGVSSTAVSNDWAGIVITNALIFEMSISSIFDCLARENFIVRNIKTAWVTDSSARRLLDAAGHSSLSMKPAIQKLIDGPCLFLCVEGSAGSLSRLQSFTVTPNTREKLFRLKSGEWGVLGSSSSRIAKELLALTFC